MPLKQASTAPYLWVGIMIWCTTQQMLYLSIGGTLCNLCLHFKYFSARVYRICRRLCCIDPHWPQMFRYDLPFCWDNLTMHWSISNVSGSSSTTKCLTMSRHTSMHELPMWVKIVAMIFTVATSRLAFHICDALLRLGYSFFQDDRKSTSNKLKQAPISSKFTQGRKHSMIYCLKFWYIMFALQMNNYISWRASFNYTLKHWNIGCCQRW